MSRVSKNQRYYIVVLPAEGEPYLYDGYSYDFLDEEDTDETICKVVQGFLYYVLQDNILVDPLIIRNNLWKIGINLMILKHTKVYINNDYSPCCPTNKAVILKQPPSPTGEEKYQTIDGNVCLMVREQDLKMDIKKKLIDSRINQEEDIKKQRKEYRLKLKEQAKASKEEEKEE